MSRDELRDLFCSSSICETLNDMDNCKRLKNHEDQRKYCEYAKNFRNRNDNYNEANIVINQYGGSWCEWKKELFEENSSVDIKKKINQGLTNGCCLNNKSLKGSGVVEDGNKNIHSYFMCEDTCPASINCIEDVLFDSATSSDVKDQCGDDGGNTSVDKENEQKLLTFAQGLGMMTGFGQTLDEYVWKPAGLNEVDSEIAKLTYELELLKWNGIKKIEDKNTSLNSAETLAVQKMYDVINRQREYTTKKVSSRLKMTSQSTMMNMIFIYIICFCFIIFIKWN